MSNWFRLFFFFVISLGMAQEPAQEKKTKEEIPALDPFDLSQWEKDLSFIDNLQIKDIVLYSLPKKMSADDQKYYSWLEIRVYDVWPLLKEIIVENNSIQAQILELKGSKKRKLVKKKKKELADIWTKRFQDLSQSRGQILTKFIHRETGKTAFDILEKLIGTFNVNIRQAQAGFFNQDLELQFSPIEHREDLYLQVILQKAFRSGHLVPIDIQLIEDED